MSARVYGGAVSWPFMDSYPFAETSPVWFGTVGSTDPVVARAAAEKLLKLLLTSEESLRAGYGDSSPPDLLNQFEKAKKRLQEIINQTN